MRASAIYGAGARGTAGSWLHSSRPSGERVERRPQRENLVPRSAALYAYCMAICLFGLSSPPAITENSGVRLCSLFLLGSLWHRCLGKQGAGGGCRHIEDGSDESRGRPPEGIEGFSKQRRREDMCLAKTEDWREDQS